MVSVDPEKVRKDLFKTFLKEGLSSKEDLDFYIKEYLGFDIPKKKVCSNHISPFRFLYDVFFERVGNAFAYGSRGSGKTRLFSMMNHLDMTFKPGITITSAGATLDQSHRCYDFFSSYYKDPLMRSMLTDNLMSYSEGTNGSSLEVITGSLKGFNGPHPVKARIDELELIRWDILQEGFSMALSHNGYKSQTIMASTRKWSGGSVSRLLKEASQRGVKLYSFCCLEVLETCQRDCFDDPKFGDCLAYQRLTGDGEYVPLCYGSAHNSRGWMHISDFLNKISLIDHDVILAQWFNRGISDSSLVFSGFYNSQVHVISKSRFEYLTGYTHPPVSWKRVSAVDFGSKFHYLKAAVDPNGTWWVYYSYFHDANQDGPRLLGKHAECIRSSPDFGLGICYYDPSGLQEALELQALGVPCTPADNDVMLGIGDVKQLLQRDARTGRPKLYILDNCEELILEFDVYAHPMGPDGMANRDLILKENDHGIDTLRYCVRSNKMAFATYTTRRAVGLN